MDVNYDLTKEELLCPQEIEMFFLLWNKYKEITKKILKICNSNNFDDTNPSPKGLQIKN